MTYNVLIFYFLQAGVLFLRQTRRDMLIESARPSGEKTGSISFITLKANNERYRFSHKQLSFFYVLVA
jgi:hypothetical protein